MVLSLILGFGTIMDVIFWMLMTISDTESKPLVVKLTFGVLVPAILAIRWNF